jgi:hypothetical protein
MIEKSAAAGRRASGGRLEPSGRVAWTILTAITLSSTLLSLIVAQRSVGAGTGMPILASIANCTGMTCTVVPDGGPFPIADPLNFTLDVDWKPEHLELVEPSDERGQWLLRLGFSYTALNSTFTDSGWGKVLLTNETGNPIDELSVQFDQSDPNGFIEADYDIFGPNTNSTFFVHDLLLSNSSLPGVGGLAWAYAKFNPVTAGVWSIPQGGSCEMNADSCETGLFCADGVCCDELCDGTGERCDLPGRVGTCEKESAMAPVASNQGLLILAGILAAFGVFAMTRRQKLNHYLSLF